MPINISGTWRDTKAWWINISGTWKEGVSVWTNVAGTWREETFQAPQLTASLLPTSVFGFDFDQPATTGFCTVTAVGGTPPYTYEWFKVSGTTMTVNQPTSQSTTFTKSFSSSAVYRCLVTDDDLVLAFTNNVAVTIDVEEE